MVSLNAKLNACVGKYRMTFTVLPRQKALKPCSADTRVKQLMMPVYRGTSPEMIFGLASCVWMSSLTRSIGAAARAEVDQKLDGAALLRRRGRGKRAARGGELA